MEITNEVKMSKRLYIFRTIVKSGKKVKLDIVFKEIRRYVEKYLLELHLKDFYNIHDVNINLTNSTSKTFEEYILCEVQYEISYFDESETGGTYNCGVEKIDINLLNLG